MGLASLACVPDTGRTTPPGEHDHQVSAAGQDLFPRPRAEAEQGGEGSGKATCLPPVLGVEELLAAAVPPNTDDERRGFALHRARLSGTQREARPHRLAKRFHRNSTLRPGLSWSPPVVPGKSVQRLLRQVLECSDDSSLSFNDHVEATSLSFQDPHRGRISLRHDSATRFCGGSLRGRQNTASRCGRSSYSLGTMNGRLQSCFLSTEQSLDPAPGPLGPRYCLGNRCRPCSMG